MNRLLFYFYILCLLLNLNNPHQISVYFLFFFFFSLWCQVSTQHDNFNGQFCVRIKIKIRRFQCPSFAFHQKTCRVTSVKNTSFRQIYDGGFMGIKSNKKYIFKWIPRCVSVFFVLNFITERISKEKERMI